MQDETDEVQRTGTRSGGGHLRAGGTLGFLYDR